MFFIKKERKAYQASRGPATAAHPAATITALCGSYHHAGIVWSYRRAQVGVTVMAMLHAMMVVYDRKIGVINSIPSTVVCSAIIDKPIIDKSMLLKRMDN